MSETSPKGLALVREKLNLIIGIGIAILLCVYMFTFQVRYDEVAVITTFDKAEAPDASDPNSGSVITEPGLYFKWFWPIQKEYKYEKKVQILEDQLQEQQTADGYAVVVNTYLAWKIENPYEFFKRLNNVHNAQQQLLPLLSDVRSVISRYDWNELVNTDASKLKIDEIEAEALTQIQARLEEQGYGIEAVELGIRRIILPETVTEKVFERMRQTRQSLAENARAEGDAKANAIKSEARSTQERILAFAERRAQAIRAEGDREAASYYGMFQEAEQFAIFLRRVEAMKAILANNTTFVLTAKDLTPLELLQGDEPTSGSRSNAQSRATGAPSDSVKE